MRAQARNQQASLLCQSNQSAGSRASDLCGRCVESAGIPEPVGFGIEDSTPTKSPSG